MYANEAPTHTADSTNEGDCQVSLPCQKRQKPQERQDRTDVDEGTELDDEDVPEEAGYGYGV